MQEKVSQTADVMKEETQKSLKELQENTNKQVKELSKTIQDLKSDVFLQLRNHKGRQLWR